LMCAYKKGPVGRMGRTPVLVVVYALEWAFPTLGRPTREGAGATP
jgi:hypothetical protein